MINNILKTTKYTLATLALIATSMFVFAGVTSANNHASVQGSLCKGGNTLKVGSNATDAACDQNRISGSQNNINNLIGRIVNVISVIVGIVAVIMIIIGGFKYITSGGDSNSITSAKHTILYAIVGLIIVALAQVIVRFVLNQSTNLTG